MIQLAVIKDEIVDGQRRAAGKKLRHLKVVALDRYNVVLASSTGDNPLQGQQFFSNFKHLAGVLTPDELATITPQLHETLAPLHDVPVSELSVVEMNDQLSLGGRDRTGSLLLYIAMRKHTGDCSEDDA